MNNTVLNHLQELKGRFSFYLLSLFLFSICGYLLKDSLVNFVLLPLSQNLYYTSPAGGFNFVLSLSIVFGFICSLPILIYQVIRFVVPAFPNNNLPIIRYVASSFILMIFGVSFAYFVALPASLYFLKQLAPGNLVSLITTEAYLSFFSRYLMGFAVLFQLPLIIMIINTIHKLSVKKLLSLEKWIIVGSFTIAAILTPTPDVVNQLIMAVPIILLYQMSLIAVLITNKRR